MAASRMQPVVFGAEDRPLRGYFHASDSPGHARAAVLICPPLGWEAIAAHWALRVLADRLAAQGFDVLRFDYDGTGDSAGDDSDTDRVTRWRGSVAAARTELEGLSVGSPVALVGIHLGATLGVAGGCAQAPFAACVLWAPFATGKAYVRQVKAYRALNPSSGQAVEEGAEEAAGFYLSPETVRTLTSVSILERPGPPAADILLLPRTAQSGDYPLAARWREQGARVETALLDGYLELMQEPRKSVLPDAVFERVEVFLGERFSTPRARPDPSVPERIARLSEGVKETALFCGRRDEVFTILTLPKDKPTKPVVVFLNTASDPRVGPNRMYVRWARALATQGHVCVRFDPRGIGDARGSGTPTSIHAYSPERLEDLTDVLQLLKDRALGTEIVLVGLCSGAYVAFHGALRAPEVKRIVMLNAQTLRWCEGDSLDVQVRRSVKSNRFYKRALLEPKTWARVLRGEVDVRAVGSAVGQRALETLGRRLRSIVPVGNSEALFVEQSFRKLLGRGTSVHLLFGENDGGIDVVESHIGAGGSRLKRFQNHFSFDVLTGPDHTFSQVKEQAALFGRVRSLISG